MVKQLTRNQRLIAIVTLVILIAYAFVNLGLAVNSFVKLKNNITKLEEFATNVQANTILDLQVTTSSSCPTGYVNAFQDRSWPGTSNGCYCGSVSSSTRSANNVTCSPWCTGSCDSTEKRIGCSDVSSKSAKTYSYVSQVQVSGSTKSAQVCIKKTDESLVTNGEFSKSGSCPSGYLSCGTGDYLFCTKQSKCPIADIQSSSTTYDQSTKANCLASNGCYVISDSGSGYVSSIQIKRTNEVSSSYPLAQMTLNEYSMCKTEDETNKTPGRYLFFLLNKRPSGCGTEGSYLWNNAFTTNEKVLFSTNGIDISSFNSYPDTDHGLGGGYYPSGETGASYNYGLYNRDYLPWAPKCRDRIATLVKNIDKVSQTKAAQTALLVVGVLSAAALGIVLSIMELMNLMGKDLPCFAGKDEEERTKLRRLKKIISYIFKGIQVPFQIWAIVICATVKGYFSNISSDNCSNSEVNAVLAYFAKTFQSTYQSNIVSIAITIASVLFDIFMSFRAKKEDAKASGNVQPVSPADEGTALKDMSQRNNQSNAFSPTQYTPTPQPQPQAHPGNIQVNVQGGFQPSPQPQPQYVPQQQQQQPQYVEQQYIPQQQAQPQYPPQQYAQPQYPPQQYPNQYPPQQYPNQYPPQQYPNQYPPQQPVAEEPAKKDDYNPTEKFGRGNYY